jgi:glucosylglycerate synthase
MADIEFSEETRQKAERIGSADIVVGVAGSVASDELRSRAEAVFGVLGPSFSSLRFVFAWPSPTGEPPAASLTADQPAALTFFPFSFPAHAAGEFWAGVSAQQCAVLALAAQLNARACIVLGPDLAALHPHPLQLFAYAVLERQCGLAMPLYNAGKYDSLINSGILAPLSRALYGRRIRYPLAFDFAASGAMCARLARLESHQNSHGGSSLLWPVTVATTQSPQTTVGQVHLDVHHQTASGGLELSAVLAQIVGSLFQEMESCAAHWQRVRGSQPVPVWGAAPAEPPEVEPVDTRPMLDSFLLGSRNLDEVWRLVLPPNTLLDLRRLTRLAPEAFRMPDELWAGIMYDFALAYRLRTLSRAHLLGALTPLYLGWVASYIREVSALSHADAEQRLEQLARAWEEKKPYLLSRWRWPDRFHP